MRFGFVARFTLAIAVFVMIIFTFKVIIPVITDQIRDETIVTKEPVDVQGKLPDFGGISDVTKKKIAFFDFIRPGIEKANARIMLDRQYLLSIKQLLHNGGEIEYSQRLEKITQYYRLDNIELSIDMLNTLLLRVDIIPRELVMVQAANESGWGTSRFARLGFNFFGQWCFSPGCGLVPSSRTDGANHEVEIFVDVEASITSYLRNLNTHNAYQLLRQIRAELRTNNAKIDAKHLVIGLRNYSQRQDDYVIELLQMLRHNKAYL